MSCFKTSYDQQVFLKFNTIKLALIQNKQGLARSIHTYMYIHIVTPPNLISLLELSTFMGLTNTYLARVKSVE